MRPGKRPFINAFLLASIGMLLLASPGAVEAKEINMLFMGNSFTFRHDLPSLVKQVFEEGQADLTVNVERIVYGGQDLFPHHDLYCSETAVRLNSITISEIEERTAVIESMLAAEKPPAFYNAFFKESTEGFTFDTVVETKSKGKGMGKDPDGGDAKVVFEDSTKTLLQKAAYDAVKEFSAGYGKQSTEFTIRAGTVFMKKEQVR